MLVVVLYIMLKFILIKNSLWSEITLFILPAPQSCHMPSIIVDLLIGCGLKNQSKL